MTKATTKKTPTLFTKGAFVGFTRSLANQKNKQSLLKIEGVNEPTSTYVTFVFWLSLSHFDIAFLAQMTFNCLHIPVFSFLFPFHTHSQFYHGKRVVYVYKVKSNKGAAFRSIWGKVIGSHGNNGLVRAKFSTNLPGQAIGRAVRVMLYPSTI